MTTPPNPPPADRRGDVSAPPQGPSLPAEASTSHPRIEDYLDHLCAPLIGVVPFSRRQASRVEWRIHIDALVAAYTELGSDPHEAVEQALKQFGNPGQLGHQWARTWKRHERRPGWFSVEPPMCAAFGWFALATVVLTLVTWLVSQSGPAAGDAERSPLTLFLGTPLTAGMLTGVLSRGRHALGTFYALASLIPLTLGTTALLPVGEGVSHDLPPLPLIQFALWMPVGCATAAIGGWLRDRWEGWTRPPFAWE